MSRDHTSVATGLLAAVLLIGAVPGAQAVVKCTAAAGVTLDMPASISVPRDRGLGTPLSAWIESGYVVGESACTYTDPNSAYSQARGALVPTGKRINDSGIDYPVYATSLPGVGVIVAAKDAGADWVVLEPTAVDLYKASWTAWGFHAKARLVATGEPIGTGTVAKLTIGEHFIAEKSNGSKSAIFPVYMSATNVTSSTCSVEAGSVSIPVDLAITSSSKLQGPVGTTDGNASFNIRLNCSTGMNVYMTLSDANNLGNSSDTLTLSPSPVQATGVGIQVRRNGTPIRFGPDASMAGNTNQISLGASPNGVLTIPFTANYIKTATTVRPGEANAVATYTLSYQ
ncbi:fimbrial protein [Pseudomonas sp. NY15181]|uniref:fimbrial protein n=1 Tax=Pseudomonas sp. NY15181 TaxID=3400349 RepID=UPI003A8838C6